MQNAILYLLNLADSVEFEKYNYAKLKNVNSVKLNASKFRNSAKFSKFP